MKYLHDFESYMKSKNYAESTIQSYSSCLKIYLSYFKKSPQNISINEIYSYIGNILKNKL